MVDATKMSAVLSEFASTLVTDFPIQRILDHLVEHVVDLLPVTSAGVTLISPGNEPRYIAASNDAALKYEALQTAVGEGPCLAAYQSGEAISIPDLSDDARFQRYASQATPSRLAAVFAFPLRQQERRLGALDLYRESPGRLGARDMGAAQTLADVAAAYLTTVQARADAREIADHYRHSALHDPLTGLPNRMLLHQRLEHASQRGRRTRADAAVLFADLDRFKAINDTFGHRVGDSLLVAVAQRLSSLLRPGDTLARVSGDEFVILCEDLHDRSDVETLAARIDHSFTTPFTVSGIDIDIDISITASVGIAFAGRGARLSDQLVGEADTAMYQTKRKGGASHQIIDLREATRASMWRDLQRELTEAIASSRLDVHYQPVARTTDGLVVGVEALLRWKHPTRGFVAPETVVSLAEQSGLITKLGGWVLERACADRMRWLAESSKEPLTLSVNVSPSQLMSKGFASSVAEILDKHQTDPMDLILEVTESIFIDDNGRASAVLQELNQLGIRVALDDFGTGYSSLSYLRALPVHMLKVDRTFLSTVGNDAVSTEFLAAITKMGHILNLTITAEGVETRSQRDAVLEIGCETSQGFYYARPMPASQLNDLILDDDGRLRCLPMSARNVA